VKNQKLTREQLEIKCEVLAAENADLRDALLNHEIMNTPTTPQPPAPMKVDAEVIDNGAGE